jgi:parallel beta-helix repeat protein
MAWIVAAVSLFQQDKMKMGERREVNRKIVWLAFVSVLLFSTVFGTIWSGGPVNQLGPTTWTVGPGGRPKYDFARIQDAIDYPRVIDGDTILVYAGTYYEFVTINKKLNVVGVNGSDLTIIDAGFNDTDVVVTIKSSDVRIENFTIQHTGLRIGNGYYGTGIRLRNDLMSINGIVISKNVISNLDIGIDAGYIPSERVYCASDSNITRNAILRSTIQGMYLSNVISFLISENTVKDNPGAYAIHLVHANGTEISRNYIFNAKAGLELEWGYSNNITDNTIAQIQTSGIEVSESYSNISNNAITGMGVNGISVNGYSNDVIGNSITDVKDTCIVESGSNNIIGYNNVTGASGISVKGNFSSAYENRITAGNKVGVSVTGFSNDIRSNIITDSWSQGISVEGSSNSITDNTVQRVDTGVWGGAFISGNTIQNCSIGVDIPSAKENVSVLNNFFQYCGQGVDVDGNSTTDITSNTFLSCLCGLHAMKDASTNFIYHNMFLNSSAADDNKGNSWDMGNRTGGNYWYDYGCEDSNGDGFGNDPYVIHDSYGNETTNRDSYPLIVPPFPIPVFWKEKTKGEIRSNCTLIGNLTVSMFHLDEKAKILTFNVTGHGYCNLTIPKDLSYGSFNVSVDNNPVPSVLTWNGTHTSIYFTCQSSTPHRVQITAQFNLNGDLNGDGTVSILDIAIVAKEYGNGLEP